MTDDIPAKLHEVVQKYEVLTTPQLLGAGISDQSITRLVREGHLKRVRRGLYQHEDSPVTEHHDLLHVVESSPQAVIVLLSALKFHGIGTQQAYEVWIQLPSKARAPSIDWPPNRIVRTRMEKMFTEGVEIHQLSGVDVPITSPARTVVDCCRHRNKLGIDVCVEALRDVLGKRMTSIGELSRISRIARVGKVMTPYLEAMI